MTKGASSRRKGSARNAAHTRRTAAPARARNEAKAGGAKRNATGARGVDAIASYARSRSAAARAVCERLRVLVDAALPDATSKVWHGGPVWFDGANPVVGYDASEKGVKLLFWNGRAFGDAALEPVGKYQAAQVVFTDASGIDERAVKRWLKLARENVFDSRAFFAKLRAERAAK